MQERNGPGFTQRVDIDYELTQSSPFAVKKTPDSLKLLVNPSILKNRGFNQTEINGAINLEEERLKLMISHSRTDAAGLRTWQDSAKGIPQADPLKKAFERLSALTSLEEKSPHLAEESKSYLKKVVAQSRATTLTDRLLKAVFNAGLGIEAKTQNPHLQTALDGVFQASSSENVTPFSVIASPDTSYSSKTAWFEGRVLPYLQFLNHQDKIQRETVQIHIPENLIQMSEKSAIREIIEWINRFLGRFGRKSTTMPSGIPASNPNISQVNNPPSATNISNSPEINPPPPMQPASESQIPPVPQPAKDEYEQHRGNETPGGKPLPIFAIDPGQTGYWEVDSYDNLDELTGRSSKSAGTYARLPVSDIPGHIPITEIRELTGYSGSELFSIPLAEGFTLSVNSLERITKSGMELLADQEGHYFLKPSRNSLYKIFIGEDKNKQPPDSQIVSSNNNQIHSLSLPAEAGALIEDLVKQPLPSLSKLEQWKQFIHQKYTYPEDDGLAMRYYLVDTSHNRLDALAAGDTLDCYLARELFIAGIKRLELSDIEWRAVSGHFVANLQNDGSAHINSGTGHAWTKVRTPDQPEWQIFDATPPGNPTQQGEGLSDQLSDMTPDDLSDQEVAQMEQDSKSGQNTSPAAKAQENYVIGFAREAGLSEQEARQVISILESLGKMTDSRNRPLITLLKEQFSRVIGEYIEQNPEHYGPVQMSRGRLLDDPVSAQIDLLAGEYDPTGFRRVRHVEEKQLSYGGWDLEIVADGSGSMDSQLGGIAKYLTQRDMSFLLHTALHQFSQEAQRRKLQLSTPLKIRSSQYMFRGSKIDVVKPLSETFTPPQMSVLWKESAKNIGGGTPAHLGLEAILDRIPPEEEQLLKDKKLLKVVAMISDGGYDSQARVDQLSKRLQDLNVVVAEFKITDARSLQELPENVAKKVLESARLLMPERIKK